MKSNLFINKNFFLIWSGKLVSRVGDKFYTIALALWILEKSGSPSTMGLVLIASALPGFLISPFAGAYVDRISKKKIVVLTDIFRGVLISLIAYLEYVNKLEVWHMITVSILISLFTAFFDPAIKALLPEVVKEKELPNANSLEELISGLSNVIGPILGAASVGIIGFFATFLINGLSFVISAVLEMFISVIDTIKEKTHNINSNIKKDVKEGFIFLSKKPNLLKVMLIIGTVHFAYASFVLILPFLASSISNNSAYNLGFLEGFFGVGMVIGATRLNNKHLKNKTMTLLIFLLFGLGFSYYGVAMLRLLNVNIMAVYLILTCLMGIIIANAASFWQLILQINTPEKMRGRIFGIATMMGNIAMPIAYGAVGILLEWIKFSTYLIVLGGLLVLISVAWYNSFKGKSYRKNLIIKNT